jgi:hypothetical protein
MLRRLLPWLSVIIVLGVIYDGSIFYSRWSRDRESKRIAAQNEAEQARKTVALLGGNELRILTFYASPAVISSGSQAMLCYGVNNAQTVRIEPAVERISPALSRCLQVAPKRDTEYKLIAEDAAGHSLSQSIVLKVRH